MLLLKIGQEGGISLGFSIARMEELRSHKPFILNTLGLFVGVE
jgi:hypothetical protein